MKKQRPWERALEGESLPSTALVLLIAALGSYLAVALDTSAGLHGHGSRVETGLAHGGIANLRLGHVNSDNGALHEVLT